MAYKNPVPELKDMRESQLAKTKKEYRPKNKSQLTESENEYSSINKAYFAFIDVLGFKKTFGDMRLSNKNTADKFKKVFSYYFSLMDSANFMKNSDICYAGQTSDTLYFYTQRSDFLMQFIKIFSHFSLYAMSKDVFFRGGIAKGPLYKKAKYQFYGDCVINAYLLENNISKNPIITVDENTCQDLKRLPEYKNIIKKECERYYIQPFCYIHSPFKLDIDDKFVLNEIDIKTIKQNIVTNKRNFEYDASNYNKYAFLLTELESVEKSNN